MSSVRRAPKSQEVAYVRNGISYNAFRHRLIETVCGQCQSRFWSESARRQMFCSPACRAKHVLGTGELAGARNPRWAGGVSSDNMRYRARQKARWPEKESARKAVAAAVRRGELRRSPCEKCGMTKSEAHHVDYSRPLDVKWLCRRHHIEAHRQEGDGS